MSSFISDVIIKYTEPVLANLKCPLVQTHVRVSGFSQMCDTRLSSLIISPCSIFVPSKCCL